MMLRQTLLSSLPFVMSLPAQDLAAVFAEVSPAVVTIEAVIVRPDAALSGKGGTRLGSGILLDEQGTILTAAHVVDLAYAVAVEFADGTKREAEVGATAPGADLALLRVRGKLPAGVAPCVLGDSDDVRVGNQVFVVGAPMGMTHTLTAGHISARRRDERFLGDMRHVEHLQTDAAINPGNSGGPLFDIRGRVMGIVCHIASHKGGAEGIGFAITSNAVRELLIDHRDVWLGFDGVLLSSALGRAFNVPDGRTGILVTRVALSSSAYRAGLRAGRIPMVIEGRDSLIGGDIVLEILGHPLATPEQTRAARAAIAALAPEDMLHLTVLRAGKIEELEARFRQSP